MLRDLSRIIANIRTICILFLTFWFCKFTIFFIAFYRFFHFPPFQQLCIKGVSNLASLVEGADGDDVDAGLYSFLCLHDGNFCVAILPFFGFGKLTGHTKGGGGAGRRG